MTTEATQPDAPAAEPDPASPAAAPAPSRGFTTGARLSFEALLIVLSVLLGFGVSEWRQASADRDLADRVLTNLRVEMEHNLGESRTRSGGIAGCSS